MATPRYKDLSGSPPRIERRVLKNSQDKSHTFCQSPDKHNRLVTYKRPARAAYPFGLVRQILPANRSSLARTANSS
uniref:Uncharacterized protein n=1 Tax=Cupriavidus taiwanensis TaxID=164546 RepID=A0A375HD23_9BURK|nr:protein of unknown function [Cupriavidus taiwanensis]